ncbi:LVIVD repeat-containing protein [Deminuibacter soli]|uniref:LVIVD repeat-containing protein n=1 Tax=Deminuibacter soli TaxID=2291815 RepID=A0A3E1NKY5_9BACT|nr:hypothetical protein [Deminuibacter soli]RFM28504.1 hypothetical protein DXN05_06770 [Deminuibacter soli]
MKSKLIAATIACCAVIYWIAGCTKDTTKEQYSFYTPVYQERETVYKNIQTSAPTPINRTGKLVVKGNYIFLNEPDRGIHIIDYSNPAQPKNIGFINIPGNREASIQGNYLYADCYTDLTVTDISDPQHVQLKKVVNNAFGQRFYSNAFINDSSKIIVDWVRHDTTIERRFSDVYKNPTGLVYYVTDNPMSFASASSSGGGSSSGVNGSMSAFALLKNRLYTCRYGNFMVYNLSNATDPAYVGSAPIASNIETIFPFGDNLFLGATTGMYIYNTADPDHPAAAGMFGHVRSCDPVVADEKTAYVTLHTNTRCQGNVNELNIIDITDIHHPGTPVTLSMTSPKGLSKTGNLLLVCDGNVKIYDVTKPASPSLISQVSVPDSYDIVTIGHTAITATDKGLYFIDFTTPASAKVLASIPILNQ